MRENIKKNITIIFIFILFWIIRSDGSHTQRCRFNREYGKHRSRLSREEVAVDICAKYVNLSTTHVIISPITVITYIYRL